ncbi:MAG: hypothetical protein HNEKOMLI_00304 [Sodalis sp. Psp]|nr:hypothetical protein [Sodalis sp. Psp]MCR3756799.1 hypothetical protein [Sodalis sp. Ppy]
MATCNGISTQNIMKILPDSSLQENKPIQFLRKIVVLVNT